MHFSRSLRRRSRHRDKKLTCNRCSCVHVCPPVDYSLFRRGSPSSGNGVSGESRPRGTTLGYVKSSWSELVARCDSSKVIEVSSDSGGVMHSLCRDGRVSAEAANKVRSVVSASEHVSSWGKHSPQRTFTYSYAVMGKRRPAGKPELNINNNNNHKAQDNRSKSEHNGSGQQRSQVKSNGLMRSSRTETGLKTRLLTTASSFVSQWRGPISLVVVLTAVACPLFIFNDFRSKDSIVNVSMSSASSSSSITDHGGWRLADEATIARLYSDVCTVERVSAMDLSTERFISEFRYRKPVIVTFPRGAAAWTDPQTWSLDSLLRDYGDMLIGHGNSVEIVRRGGNGEFHDTLTDFVRGFLGNSSSLLHDGDYVFDRSFFTKSLLASTIVLPPYFSADATVDDGVFFLGPSGSGVVFHKHADTWNGVVYGSKRWFLYPSTFTPPGGVYHGFSINDWYDMVYPNLSATHKPAECVQRAGEILYVPEGFYHATLNIGDTVAVSWQKKQATLMTEKLFYKATALESLKNSPDVHNQLFNIHFKLRELLPRNTEVVNKMAEQFSALGQHKEAVDLLQEVVKMDPYFVHAFTNLGMNLAKLRQLYEAEKALLHAVQLSPRLWDVYRHYGTFLLERGRHEEAIPVLAKGAELNPRQMGFWSYLKLAQEEVGDLQGAKQSQEKIEELSKKFSE